MLVDMKRVVYVLVQLIWIFNGFLFKNNICLTVLGLSRFLFLELTSPALGNTPSQGTDEDGAHK